MAAFLLQLSLLVVASLPCVDAQLPTGPPSFTSPDIGTTDGPTTPVGTEMPFVCPGDTLHSCSPYDLCIARPWQSCNCHCLCDPLCGSYGDCCLDAMERCGVGMVGVGSLEGTMEDTRCVQTVDFHPEKHAPRSGHRLVAICPRDWTGAASVTKLCQDTVGMDGFAAVPVEGSDGRHYRNVYCAMCHGLHHTNVTFWSTSYRKISAGFRIRPVNSTFVLKLARGQIPMTGYEKFFEPLIEIGEHFGGPTPRRCAVLDVASCPISDPHALEVCQRHYAPIAWNGMTYRNLACLLCTHSFLADSWQELCTNFSSGDTLRGGSMATLLIFSDRTDIRGYLTHRRNSVGSASACTSLQIYDPFLASCRDLSCLDGFALEEGGTRCARIRQTENEVTVFKPNVAVVLTSMVSLISNTYAQNKNHLHKIKEEVVAQIFKDYQTSIPVCKAGEDMTESNRQKEICGDIIVQWSCPMDDAMLDSTHFCLTGSVFNCSVNMSFKSLPPSIDHFIHENEILSSRCFVSRVGNHTIQPDYLAVATPCDELIANDTEESNSSNGFTSKVAYVRDNDSGHFVVSQNDSCTDMVVNCPLLTFSREDYVITGALNDSIRLTAHDRVFRSGEFKIKINGDVEVCNFLESTATPPFKRFGLAHDILTGTGSTLSLIGLVVTSATYVTFPSLRRNAAGLALKSLVGALFLAQLTMVIGLDRVDVPALCVTFAISSHYFWLAAFFWMNILAVDIYRTFGIGTSLSDPNERSFLRYALYGWGAPTLIVVTVVILSFCDCVEADVYYGSADACWVGNGTANLLSFGLPIVVILCSNAVLFSLTVAGVKRTRMVSKRMNITQGQSGSAAKRPSNDLILYLKLTAIMGFTWVFGFVASFSGVEFFWYPYIVLSSLQGTLVCLAFVCNRRVMGMWRAWLNARRERQTSAATLSRGQKSLDPTVTKKGATKSTNF